MTLPRDSILALAPDASSAKAAQSLLNPSLWSNLGANPTAVWGECQGSGSKPYQTQVDLGGPSFKCSCPSRKFPCKHGLALLLLQVDKPAAFGKSDPPAWVSEWLDAREAKERKRTETAKAKTPSEPVSAEDADKAAARNAKRQGQRWASIEQGAADLHRFIGDVLRRGLGALSPSRTDDWSTMAARLVDAQAPGLGQRVRQAAEVIGGREDWPERLLHRIGLLTLAVRAIRRRNALDDATQADLRAVVGWPLDKADVVAHNAIVEDDWLVLGSAVEERDNKLFERRVWLAGLRSGRHAFVLDHAFGGTGFEHTWVVGRVAAAPLAFWPSAAPLRALALSPPAHRDEAAPGPAGDAWKRVAHHYAACPWTPLQPLVLHANALERGESGLRAWTGDRCIDINCPLDDQWTLLAVSGGAPVTLAGEWNGEVLQPLAAWQPPAPRVAWQRSLQA